MKSRRLSSRFGALRGSRGIGLIEVMIALVILSIGVLALLGMQINGKKANYDGVQRTAATHLAWDLIERIRSNRDGIASYVIPVSSPIGAGTRAQASCSAASPCTAAALASADLYEWEQTLLGASEQTAANESVGGLVTPRACVEDLGNSEYQITVAWRGTQEVPDADPGTNACGEGAGSYGAADEYRRFVSIRFFAAI